MADWEDEARRCGVRVEAEDGGGGRQNIGIKQLACTGRGVWVVAPNEMIEPRVSACNQKAPRMATWEQRVEELV